MRDFGDQGQLAHAVLEVERGAPVGGFVLGALAGGAGGAEEVVGGGVEGEGWGEMLVLVSNVFRDGVCRVLTAATVDGVQVGAGLAGTDQGVDAGVARDAVALESP